MVDKCNYVDITYMSIMAVVRRGFAPTNPPGGHYVVEDVGSLWPLPQGLSLALMATGQYLDGTPNHQIIYEGKFNGVILIRYIIFSLKNMFR